MRFIGSNVQVEDFEKIINVVRSSSSFKEALNALGFEYSRHNSNNLANWCLRNFISTEHLWVSRESKIKTCFEFLGITPEELKEKAGKVTSVSDLCRQLRIPPAGHYHKRVVFYLNQASFDFSKMQRVRKKGTSNIRRLDTSEFFKNGVLHSGPTIRKRLIALDVKYECAGCALPPVWNNSPITLEVDHIDGNPQNNLITNLRFLCPNCHSQTTTNCGKKLKGRYTIAKEYLAAPELPKQEICHRSLTDKGAETATKKSVIRLCSFCNVNVVRSSNNRCPKCYQLSNRRVSRPSKEELQEILQKQSFRSYSVQIGVTDSAVRKWCKSYGMDPKKLGRSFKLS